MSFDLERVDAVRVERVNAVLPVRVGLNPEAPSVVRRIMQLVGSFPVVAGGWQFLLMNYALGAIGGPLGIAIAAGLPGAVDQIGRRVFHIWSAAPGSTQVQAIANDLTQLSNLLGILQRLLSEPILMDEIGHFQGDVNQYIREPSAERFNTAVELFTRGLGYFNQLLEHIRRQQTALETSNRNLTDRNAALTTQNRTLTTEKAVLATDKIALVLEQEIVRKALKEISIVCSEPALVKALQNIDREFEAFCRRDVSPSEKSEKERKALDAKLDAVVDQLVAYQKEMHEKNHIIEASHAQEAKLRTQIKADELRKDELAHELNLANGRVRAAREEGAQLKTQVQDLQAIVYDTSSAKFAVEAKLKHAQFELQNVQEKLLRERNEHALELEREQLQYKEFREQSEAKHKQALTELAAAKDKEIATFKALYDQSESEQAKLREQILELEKKVIQAQEAEREALLSRARIQAELNQLREDHAELQKANGSLYSQLIHAHEEVNTLNRSVDETRNSLQKLQLEMTTIKQQASAATPQIIMNEDYAAMRREIDELRKALFSKGFNPHAANKQ